MEMLSGCLAGDCVGRPRETPSKFFPARRYNYRRFKSGLSILRSFAAALQDRHFPRIRAGNLHSGALDVTLTEFNLLNCNYAFQHLILIPSLRSCILTSVKLLTVEKFGYDGVPIEYSAFESIDRLWTR
jgi:hypothetical protein